MIEAYVRNVYELIQNEIPLWAYRDYIKHGEYNWGREEFEECGTTFKDTVQHAKDMCKEYYSK